MAKRFTDTGKWDKAWFRKLSPKMKCVWMFLCDRCDHAGVWEFDEDAFIYFVGEKITSTEILNTFGDKVEFCSKDKLVIKSFIEFQYGNLNPANRVHQSVLNRLEKLAPCKPLISPLNGAKDKEEDKDMDKDMDKVKGGVGENLPRLAEIWNSHCGKLAKVTKTNPHRNKKAAERLKEDDESSWIEAVKKLSASPFCNGTNDRGWKATFDFILQPEARLKILEGFYDGKTSKKYKNERDNDPDEEFRQIMQGVKDGIRARESN